MEQSLALLLSLRIYVVCEWKGQGLGLGIVNEVIPLSKED